MRCGYHLGHSETDREENGIEGQHCCCPDHPDVWEDPDGRRVPIEGTSYRSSTIFRTTPAERELQRQGRAWNTGNLYSHVQQDGDIARSRRNHRQRSRSGSGNRGARSASQGSNKLRQKRQPYLPLQQMKFRFPAKNTVFLLNKDALSVYY